MRMLFVLLSSVLLAAPSAAIEDPSDQDVALQAREAGELLGIATIKADVGRVVGGRFIGCDCDPHAARYRMKYRVGKKVVMVDVDARTGNILRIQD